LKRNPVNYIRLPSRFPARVIHYHHSRWPHLMAFALGPRRRDARYVVTLHAGDIRNHFPQLVSRIPLVARSTRWALRRFDLIITVDSDIAQILRRHIHDRPVEVVPAFLRAGDGEHEAYDTALETFLRSGPVIVVAAYGVQFLSDGRELYGLDTAVAAFTALAQERTDVRLAIFVARKPTSRRARRHLRRLERRLEEEHIRDRANLAFGHSLLPALRANSVYVRPTRAEGDAVSIREALEARVPVIASDVVPRPPGVITFPAENAQDLCVAIRSALDQMDSDAASSVTVCPMAAAEFSDDLVRIYRVELTKAGP
jgi:glycosyltransferase involved in cell wall biosynthesis